MSNNKPKPRAAYQKRAVHKNAKRTNGQPNPNAKYINWMSACDCGGKVQVRGIY